MDPAPAGRPPWWLLVLAWATAAATLAGVLPVAVPHDDWINHSWLTEQVASRWLRDGLPPLLLDIAGRTGDPWLLFYGLGVYVPLSPLVWILGSPGGIKVAAVSLQALLGWRVTQLVWRGSGSAPAAACLSTLVLSAVYPIAGLGARGAVVEFIAYDLLGIALVSLGLGWLPGPGRRVAFLVESCCAATLGCLAHPPTFWLGVLFLLPVLPALLWALGRPAFSRRETVVFSTALVLCALTLALYLAIVLPSLGQIDLFASNSLRYIHNSIDHPFARFYPLPLDFRVDRNGFSQTREAYLSAPFHGTLAVVLLAAWLAAARSRRLTFRSLPALLPCLFAILFVVALSLPIWSMDPTSTPEVKRSADGSPPSRLVGSVQFAYRLVGTQDLLLVLLACLTFLRIGGRDAVGAWLARSRIGWNLLLVCTTVGFAAAANQALDLLIPFTLAQGVPRTSKEPATHPAELAPAAIAVKLAEVKDTTRRPATFYSFGAYGMSRIFPLLGPEAGTPITVPTRAGLHPFRRRLRVDCRSACTVVTDVVPTRFLRVSVDGRDLPRRELRCSGPPIAESAWIGDRRSTAWARRLSVVLPAGPHRIVITLLPWWVRTLSPAVAAIAAVFFLAELALAWPVRRLT